MFLIFDTETTGLPRDFKAPLTDSDNWPRAVQIAWQLHAADGSLLEAQNFVIQPEGFDIPFNAAKIHGITNRVAQKRGVPLPEAIAAFSEALQKAQFTVGHNIQFDHNILGAEYLRLNQDNPLAQFPAIDTSHETTDFCKIPGGRGGQYKYPKLEELYHLLFEEKFAEAHNAAADVEATSRAFLELVRRQVFSDERLHFSSAQRQTFNESNPDTIQPIGLKIESFKELDAQLKEEEKTASAQQEKQEDAIKTKQPFVHLHMHSQYSILQATCEINAAVAKAKNEGMPALALTDVGNLYGAFLFVRAAHQAGIKPIVGCELYVCKNHRDRTRQDNGYRQVFLAKNKVGYHHLAWLASHAAVDGFYYVPRIDKELLLQYKENLIATTGNHNGEIPSLILNVGEKQAEEAFVWYKEQFGEDFYVELLRHGLEEDEVVNETLLRFARKYDVKYFAASDAYYLNEEDAPAHDILLCVKEGEVKNTPIGRGRGYRFGLPNNSYYLKTQAEMQQLWADMPEALTTTAEIAEKIEGFTLERDVLLPKFDIPEEFTDAKDAEDGGNRGENSYLRHLTYEGARERYGELTENLESRLDFELETIAATGYPGYFLIVQDFTSQARKMGVSVGPGRGSAAGSAVAYCIGITNVDPIKYDLLFERFLNPDRISMPDIDIDFDDEGRNKIIDWVVQKYGQNQVAQIITYGTMAAKSAIRDTGRVLELPLSDTDRIAKLVPDNLKLSKLFSSGEKELAEMLNNDDLAKAKLLKELAGKNTPEARVVEQAKVIEGSVRSTGIHACGVIITPDDIRKYVPVGVSKDAQFLATQFDNSLVEDAGLLKMDFLGLRNLSIIKDAIEMIEERHNLKIDPDQIPLDDPETLALFARGETVGTFQFESPGMRKHLRSLKPDQFADLIAMNALFRPGPMEYIPNFIARKNGSEAISYDLPEMQDYLEETYGITVYQEQVMLLSQKLAGFTKGEADVLRKAMGKKKRDVLDKMRPQFIEQGKEKGHEPKVLEKIWGDWEKFAAYAFNKSHSTCYSVVAFHTGYLKAHYPQEYMASVLTHYMKDIKDLTRYTEECKRMGIKVLCPDVNESEAKFTVNREGQIRFGLIGMKGVGRNAVETIVAERQKNGSYSSIFDMLKRVDLTQVNRRTLESLALGGAFDSFENEHRAVYFYKNGDDSSFLEKAARFAQKLRVQESSAQVSLFGESSEVQLPEPEIPQVEEWPRLTLLNKEKEVNGIYLSSHPLDDFRLEMENFCTHSAEDLNDLEKVNEFSIGGMVTNVRHATSKNGKPYGFLTVEDYRGSFRFALFGEDYLNYKPYLEPNLLLYIKGRKKTYTPRYEGAQTRVEASIQQIELLADVLETHGKGITIRFAAEEIDQAFIDQLNDVMTDFPGDKWLRVKIYDREKGKTALALKSRGWGITLNSQLFNVLNTNNLNNFKIET